MSIGPTSSLCRLCLRRTEAHINLLQGNFKQIIFDLTSIEISPADKLPKIACINCIDELQNANNTCKKIVKSDGILKARLQSISHEENMVDTIDNNERFHKSVEDAVCAVKTESVINDEDNEIELICSTSISDYEEIKIEHSDPGDEVPILESDVHVSPSMLKAIKDVFQSKPKLKKTKKPLKCETCNIEFKDDRYAYNLHMCKHKKSKCKLCGILIRTDNMNKHMECHTSGPRVCDLCGTTCKNVESLRGHIFYMHRSSADEYKCPDCDRSFRMKYKLELHKKKEHIGLRNHICKTCKKGFFTHRDMTHHINMTHLKLRPHICPHCERGFSSKYALKTHVRQHTKETPYKCYVCAEGFRQNVSLRTHLKSKHSIEESKDFLCEFCDKAFSTDHALKVHMRLHTDDNYKCGECSELFQQKTFLLNHLKSVHNVQQSDSASENIDINSP